ncbi:MAG TPA: tetratricopeptide repeat protein [Alphaproteobacteria bacterium]|nr:tetratricopeptide repeat protein [Alphaproteobacteria bacterium]
MAQKNVSAIAGREHDLFNQALQFHRSGQIPEAEKLYRQILSLNPRYARALHMLGIIALDFKHPDHAEDLVRKALAEESTPAFHHTLGNILNARGRLDEAIAHYKKALEKAPDTPDFLNNLGATLIALCRYDEALPLFQKILEKDPKSFNALSNIGAALQNRKQYEEALEYYAQAITVKPDAFNVRYNVAQIFKSLGRQAEALAGYEQVLELKPDHTNALLNAAHILRVQNRFDEAMDYFSKIPTLDADEETRANAHANRGQILHRKGNCEEAIREYKRALEFLPDAAEILSNLGVSYNAVGQYEEALECYEKSLVLQPGTDETYNNISGTLKNLGRLEESMACCRKAMELAPHKSWIYSNLLLAMIYSAEVTPEDLLAETQKFDEKHARPALRTRELVRDPEPDRKLNIGYVTADFCKHPVNYFFEPLLSLHDHAQFEIYAYANLEREDEITERLRKKFDHWHDIAFMDDDAVADLIEKDRIDILMDISGHTRGNRLMVFARKPAPVQVTWLAYPATTGMQAMDYRITDSYAEPPGMTEQYNVEKLWRLPEIFCCYQAHENSPPVTGYPLFEDNGYITFGCFNNFAKVTDPVLETWGKIMAQVPDSRLMLEIPGINLPAFRANVEERLKRHGIPLERTVLERRIKSNQFVLYNEIDIALDPFPCVGGTTSMDTLWMGVPFVTLAGKHFGARMGVTILTNAGLQELIAENREEYIKIAVDLATNRARLKTLRHDLREKIATSPLMNQQSFTRNMENAYREMWRKYCAEKEK